jgi:hypothetical protein
MKSRTSGLSTDLRIHHTANLMIMFFFLVAFSPCACGPSHIIDGNCGKNLWVLKRASFYLGIANFTEPRVFIDFLGR